jgi:hypothetical protein
MKKIFIILITALTFLGCVSMQKVSVPEDLPQEVAAAEEVSLKEVLEIPDSSPELQNIEGEEPEEYVQKKGVVFAKTDFQGLLETRYVRFLFEDLEGLEHKFQLHIGEVSEQQTFPWDVKTVKPGYFFVELPVGKYKISSVSIPVGSTMATEKMNVTLEVSADAVCYVGTLKMVGTKEKIKLGGLPVIKPGFEYTVEVLDERDEGMGAFRQNYPDFSEDVLIKLMQLAPVVPESI